MNKYEKALVDLRVYFSAIQVEALEHFLDVSLEDHQQAIDALTVEIEEVTKRLDNI